MAEHAIDLEFDLPCTPEAAFRAWTVAEEVTAWWGEAGVYRTTGWSADVRSGGAWRADFAGDNGEPFSAEGRYLTVRVPDRLVWTWRASWSPEAENTIDMTFEASDRGTLLRLRNFGFEDIAEAEDAKAGWLQMTGWLGDHLRSTSPRI